MQVTCLSIWLNSLRSDCPVYTNVESIDPIDCDVAMIQLHLEGCQFFLKIELLARLIKLASAHFCVSFQSETPKILLS